VPSFTIVNFKSKTQRDTHPNKTPRKMSKKTLHKTTHTNASTNNHLNDEIFILILLKDCQTAMPLFGNKAKYKF
jgi:hypothetical protein